MKDYHLVATEAETQKLLQIYGSMDEIQRCYVSLSCILERKGIHGDEDLSREFIGTSSFLKRKGNVDMHIWSQLSFVNRN
jgi:hypothetical protein